MFLLLAGCKSDHVVGEKVIVDTDGTAYLGTIVGVESFGKVKVDFGGDAPEVIPSKRIKAVLPKDAAPKFKSKDKVLVSRDGAVYVGKINYPGKRDYRIDYDDGVSETVEAERVLMLEPAGGLGLSEKPPEAEATAEPAAEGTGRKYQQGEMCDTEGKRRWCDGACIDVRNNQAHCGGCLPCGPGYHCDFMMCKDHE